jgi:phosphinothricin acetyltransferase
MIRPAEARDVAAIARLWNIMIRESDATFTTIEKTTEDIAALIAGEPPAVWVAEAASGIAGFVRCGTFRAGPGYAHVVEHTIIVAADAQGKGVADRLLDVAERQMSLRGKSIMIAGISSTNLRAQRFHHRCGYQEVGRLPGVGRKFGRTLDLVLTQKNLDAGSIRTDSDTAAG